MTHRNLPLGSNCHEEEGQYDSFFKGLSRGERNVNDSVSIKKRLRGPLKGLPPPPICGPETHICPLNGPL